ncbi:uncharacterized protein BDR25DRAFT_357836 [Lindgomyces ingoldianus]|uniref:Uncharacterized protein n=1 Tax=Lindgomyces ingoldianus TaxID=673940 RepID=A0ACB6QM43_9PLEO|nr:uncharacterized protein BDR25DRAFT_357836 [Lindgomyces ingoldianus]KAF2468079.1 hypothetical protein BDR25DRAFT_357836 [Lindgomyces ingoldianus]
MVNYICTDAIEYEAEFILEEREMTSRSTKVGLQIQLELELSLIQEWLSGLYIDRFGESYTMKSTFNGGWHLGSYQKTGVGAKNIATATHLPLVIIKHSFPILTPEPYFCLPELNIDSSFPSFQVRIGTLDQLQRRPLFTVVGGIFTNWSWSSTNPAFSTRIEVYECMKAQPACPLALKGPQRHRQFKNHARGREILSISSNAFSSSFVSSYCRPEGSSNLSSRTIVYSHNTSYPPSQYITSFIIHAPQGYRYIYPELTLHDCLGRMLKAQNFEPPTTGNLRATRMRCLEWAKVITTSDTILSLFMSVFFTEKSLLASSCELSRHFNCEIHTILSGTRSLPTTSSPKSYNVQLRSRRALPNIVHLSKDAPTPFFFLFEERRTPLPYIHCQLSCSGAGWCDFGKLRRFLGILLFIGKIFEACFSKLYRAITIISFTRFPVHSTVVPKALKLAVSKIFCFYSCLLCLAGVYLRLIDGAIDVDQTTSYKFLLAMKSTPKHNSDYCIQILFKQPFLCPIFDTSNSMAQPANQEHPPSLPLSRSPKKPLRVHVGSSDAKLKTCSYIAIGAPIALSQLTGFGALPCQKTIDEPYFFNRGSIRKIDHTPKQDSLQSLKSNPWVHVFESYDCEARNFSGISVWQLEEPEQLRLSPSSPLLYQMHPPVYPSIGNTLFCPFDNVEPNLEPKTRNMC